MMKWFQRFMIGRYGVIDELSKLIFGISIGAAILSIFVDSTIIRVISMILPLAFVFRTFSKNIGKRNGENIRFLRFINPIKRKVRSRSNKIKGMKEYKYFKCDNCGQEIRVPRGKGKIAITCPKCGNKMIKKS